MMFQKIETLLKMKHKSEFPCNCVKQNKNYNPKSPHVCIQSTKYQLAIKKQQNSKSGKK